MTKQIAKNQKLKLDDFVGTLTEKQAEHLEKSIASVRKSYNTKLGSIEIFSRTNDMKNVLLKSLKEAGKLVADAFGKIKEIEVKENQSSIVTKTDKEAENLIVSIIKKSFPSHNIIGEETGFHWNGSEFTWIIDPIDGTSNFASGIPNFAVMLALLKDFKPIMGGIYLPFYKDLYFVEVGKGAFRNNKPISVTKEKSLKNVLVSCNLDYNEDIKILERKSLLFASLTHKSRNVRSNNCIVDICYTADGRFGGSILLDSKIWDVAPIYLIIKEAGGKVTDRNGVDLDFMVDKNNYKKNYTLVASNRALHPMIVELTRSMGL